MTIRHFQIFNTVCTTGSFTEAAQQLNMTQPAVSMAIKELEANYRTKLFERANRRIFLTEAGNMLRSYSENIVTQTDEAEAVLRDSAGFKKCRIGVNVAAGENFLSDMLDRIGRMIPEAEISVVIGSNGDIEKKLYSNEIDIAVTDYRKDDDNICSKKVYCDPQVVICNPALYDKSSITVEELSEQRLLLRETGSGSRNCADAVFNSCDVTVTPFVESSSTLGIINAAKHGYGFGIVSEKIADNFADEKLKKVHIEDIKAERQYYLSYNRKKFMTSVMKRITEVI